MARMLRWEAAGRQRDSRRGDVDSGCPSPKELLGHANISTTMIYSHLGTDGRREEVSRMLGGRPPSEPDLAGRRRRKDAQLGPHAAVGDRIRAARRQAGLTVEALAAKSGAGCSTLIRVERGFHLPRAKTLQRVAEVTGVTTDWMLTGRDLEDGRA